MSSISTIYDTLRSTLATTLPNHTELNNPYVLEDEADIMFDAGYTIGLFEGENTNRNLCPKLSVSRTFTITLSRRTFSPDRDITERVAAEKNLFEDHLLVVKALQCIEDDNISKIEYISDNGLEFLLGDRFNILLIQSTFTVEYFENL